MAFTHADTRAEASRRVRTTMRAIVCHGPEDYRVEDVSRPRPGDREMIIRIGACGVCASDCKCWSGAKMFWGGESPWVKAPGSCG